MIQVHDLVETPFNVDSIRGSEPAPVLDSTKYVDIVSPIKTCDKIGFINHDKTQYFTLDTTICPGEADEDMNSFNTALDKLYAYGLEQGYIQDGYSIRHVPIGGEPQDYALNSETKGINFNLQDREAEVTTDFKPLEIIRIGDVLEIFKPGPHHDLTDAALVKLYYLDFDKEWVAHPTGKIRIGDLETTIMPEPSNPISFLSLEEIYQSNEYIMSIVSKKDFSTVSVHIDKPSADIFIIEGIPGTNRDRKQISPDESWDIAYTYPEIDIREGVKISLTSSDQQKHISYTIDDMIYGLHIVDTPYEGSYMPKGMFILTDFYRILQDYNATNGDYIVTINGNELEWTSKQINDIKFFEDPRTNDTKDVQHILPGDIAIFRGKGATDDLTVKLYIYTKLLGDDTFKFHLHETSPSRFDETNIEYPFKEAAKTHDILYTNKYGKQVLGFAPTGNSALLSPMIDKLLGSSQ